MRELKDWCVSSDARIKKKPNVNDDTALDKILNILTKTYECKWCNK